MSMFITCLFAMYPIEYNFKIDLKCIQYIIAIKYVYFNMQRVHLRCIPLNTRESAGIYINIYMNFPFSLSLCKRPCD